MILLAAALLLPLQDREIQPSVVKIFTSQRLPNMFQPWTKRPVSDITGSGVVIDGNRILTNAHVVSYASQIYVQGYQESDKVAASVIAAAPGIDLALVELEDAAFFTGHPPLPLLDEIPKIKDTINVYGYPTGGKELSITEGIISRVEFSSFYFGTTGLRVQVDAALNPGNSGGPAVLNGSLIGLVSSRIQEAENIGYLIPVEEIKMFFHDLEDGTYEGNPQIFAALQTTGNPALRAKIGMVDETSGMAVTRVDDDDPGSPLEKWDVITRIGDHSIDSEGNVQIEKDLRLNWRYLIPKLAHDGTVGLTVLREGEERTLDMPVKPRRDQVLPYLLGDYPRYFIYGPLVFTAATKDLFIDLGGEWHAYMVLSRSELAKRINERPEFEGEELVVVSSRMFPHRITKDYSDPFLHVVGKVNGTKVENLRHLVRILRDVQDEFVVFEFADPQENMVFKTAEISASTEEILNDNGIRYQFSDDLKDVWEKGD